MGISHCLCRSIVGVVALLVLATASPGWAQPTRDPEQAWREVQALGWQRGPTTAQIGAVATINVPEGLGFLDGPNTRRLLELTQNPPRDDRYTLATPDLTWFAIFFFENSGYVRDDEKLDADALLNALQENDKRGNSERKRLGMPGLHTAGWHVPPHYDAGTKRLEWGLRLRGDDGHITVNYTIRMLGRHGVMHAVLVSDPEDLEKNIVTFKGALGGYGFVPGERYAEFKSGDRIAEYGLAALVLGGAAVVATKSGFGKAIGKFLILGLIALGGGIVAFFRKTFKRS
jgi:uncharacterized membrane-anchored protein